MSLHYVILLIAIQLMIMLYWTYNFNFRRATPRLRMLTISSCQCVWVMDNFFVLAYFWSLRIILLEFNIFWNIGIVYFVMFPFYSAFRKHFQLIILGGRKQKLHRMSRSIEHEMISFASLWYFCSMAGILLPALWLTSLLSHAHTCWLHLF